MKNDEVNKKIYVIMTDYIPNVDIKNAENMKMNLSGNGFTVSWNQTINNTSGKPEVKDNIEAVSTLIKLGLTYEIDGEGAIIKNQLPPAGTMLFKNANVILITN